MADKESVAGATGRLPALGCGLVLLFLLGLGLRTAATRAASAGSELERTIVVGGVTRTYLLHLPAGRRAEARLPLLFAFHGHGGRSRGMDRLTHLGALADRTGFLVVYPQGLGEQWNDGRLTGRFAAAVDDVGFVRAMLQELESRYPIDRHRVFATGMSNGAFFSHRLACEMAPEIAAIASVAGELYGDLAAACHPARPLSVLLIHGTADPIVPYGSGRVGGRRGGNTLGVAATAAFWERIDGCQGSAVASTLPNARPEDGMRVHREIHDGCAAGTEVTVYTVDHGGHTWPGGLQYLPAVLIGHTSRSLDASAILWDFFARHPLP